MVKVLILLDRYIPGHKAGGPIRSIQNLVHYLQDSFDFWIVTRDRDKGDPSGYDNIAVDQWNRVEGGHVYYGSPGALSIIGLLRLVRAVDPNCVYLNSFFSRLTIRFLLLRRLGLFPGLPVILAPRGELSQGALQLKAAKKKLFMSTASILALYRGLLWQATSSDEAVIIRSLFDDPELHLVPNLPTVWKREELTGQRGTKDAGSVRFIFLSRIAPKKNLQFVLKQLRGLKGYVMLEIVGPVEDSVYWEQCRQLIQKMPSNVQVNYSGDATHDQVAETLRTAHFFLLPTLNENFGHAIFEALAAGLPVVISDRTPWRNLTDKSIGWDLPLDEPKRWTDVLQQCVAMSTEKYEYMSGKARRFACTWPEASGAVARNQALFTDTLRDSQPISD